MVKENNNEMSLEEKAKNLGDRISRAILSTVKIENFEKFERIKSQGKEIMEIFAEGTPLTAGKVLMRFAEIISETDREKHAGLIKDCYVFAFEIAIDAFENLGKDMEKKRLEVKGEIKEVKKEMKVQIKKIMESEENI